MNFINKIPPTQKGIALAIIGILLLFYTLGIMERGLNLILIAIAIGMIVYGIYLARLDDLIRSLIKRVSKRD